MDRHTIDNRDIAILWRIFMIHVCHTGDIAEVEFCELEAPLAIDQTELVLLGPREIGESVSLGYKDLMLTVPFPVRSCVDQDLLGAIDRTVDGKKSGIEVETHVLDCGILVLRQDELSVTQAISFPKDDLWANLTIRHDSSLETSN